MCWGREIRQKNRCFAIDSTLICLAENALIKRPEFIFEYFKEVISIVFRITEMDRLIFKTQTSFDLKPNTIVTLYQLDDLFASIFGKRYQFSFTQMNENKTWETINIYNKNQYCHNSNVFFSLFQSKYYKIPKFSKNSFKTFILDRDPIE